MWETRCAQTGELRMYLFAATNQVSLALLAFLFLPQGTLLLMVGRNREHLVSNSQRATQPSLLLLLLAAYCLLLPSLTRSSRGSVAAENRVYKSAVLTVFNICKLKISQFLSRHLVSWLSAAAAPACLLASWPDVLPSICHYLLIVGCCVISQLIPSLVINPS